MSARLSPQQLQAVLAGVLDALIVTDPHGNILYMNPAAQSVFGFEHPAPDERESVNLQRYIRETFDLAREDGQPIPEAERPFTRALRGEPYRDVVLRVRHKERREEKVFAFSGAIVAGNPPLSVLTIRDVSEQRNAELRYRISFETNPAPTVVARLADAAVVDVNEGFCHMTNLPKGQAVGQSLMHLGLLPEREDFRDAIDGLKEGRSIEHLPTTIGALGQGKRIVLVSARPIEIDRQPCGIFTFLDITDLRASEALAARRAGELREANAELESFNYSVAHDLRAPLRGIDGFSQVLLEEYGDELDDTARHYLERIHTGTKRIGELIDDLLDLSRLSRARVRPEEVDLGEVARAVLDELREAEPDREVTLVIAPDLRAVADPSLLHVALTNLLENAWKFSRPRELTRIEVGRTDTGGEAVYFVRDNGVGFNPAYAEKLFVPFQRLHRPDEFEGTGIGLATVQRVINKHGGRIWA